MATLLCIGLGYCARHYLSSHSSRFEHAVGTSRSPASNTNSVTSSLFAFDGQTASSELRAAVASATHLLVSAAPNEDRDPVLAVLGDAIAAAPQLRSIVYLSSLGVYGDHGGAWIDESTPTVPAHERGAARVRAELAWRALGRARGVPVAILRLAGIYGPGRNAFERLLAGRAHRIEKPGHVFNRVHVFDIAQAIDAAFARDFDGTVNVADDEPAPPDDPIVFAAPLLGIAPPPELSMEEAARTLSPFVMSFYRGCARVRNERLKRELGVTLRYPTYREGLRAIWEAEREGLTSAARDVERRQGTVQRAEADALPLDLHQRGGAGRR